LSMTESGCCTACITASVALAYASQAGKADVAQLCPDLRKTARDTALRLELRHELGLGVPTTSLKTAAYPRSMLYEGIWA
jgi:hypothetical protein